MSFDPAQAVDCLKNSNKILITTHIGPDGDALGSSKAMACLARSLGKEVRFCFMSKIPEFLAWLDFPMEPVHNIEALGDWVPDLLICVDCGSPERPGPDFSDFFSGKKPAGWEKVRSLQLDHHRSNPEYAELNWVEPDAGATCELIARLARHMEQPLAGELGEALYLGLSSDTGNFTYSNTSPEILRMAADIVELGLPLAEFTEKNENNWSLPRMQLWGDLMQRVQLFANGSVVSITVTNALLKKHACLASDLEGFVSFIRKLKNVKVSLLVRERPSTGCKVSLRSQGGEGSLDVQQVAAFFGGGGHKAAAGIEMVQNAPEVHRLVLNKLLESMGWAEAVQKAETN